jgi:hypothetical protein
MINSLSLIISSNKKIQKLAITPLLASLNQGNSIDNINKSSNTISSINTVKPRH